jgi:hypothetical protein
MLPLNFKACPLSNVKLAKKRYPEKYSNSRENNKIALLSFPNSVIQIPLESIHVSSQMSIKLN